MLRAAGALLVLGGCTALALSAVVRLDERVEDLRALLAAVEGMEREMAFRLAPMDALLERAAAAAGGQTAAFFLRCRGGLDRLGEKSFARVWEDELSLLDGLGETETAALRELGGLLGRFDGGNQREGLSAAAERLRSCLTAAEAERTRLGRVYTALGLTGGALLAILLI